MVKGFYPATLQEALRICYENEVVVYAGGTDYMVRRNPEDTLLFLGHLKELKVIGGKDDGLHVGALCTYTELLQSEKVPSLLKQAIAQIASPAIRNLGTIGGNICNASPAGDTLPALYSYDAKVRLVSAGSIRIVPIEEFILGVRRTSIRKDELVTEIILPEEEPEIRYYSKIGARKSEAISKVSFAAVACIESGLVQSVAISLGAVGQTVVRCKEIEEKILGKRLGEIRKMLPDIISRYERKIAPIDDQRSTALYRKKVSLRLIEDFLTSLEGR